MKLFLIACFAGFVPAAAIAQATPPPDASNKPAPFRPLIAKEHEGLGRIGVRLAFDKVTVYRALSR